jgi:hypothetical protein
VAGLVVAVGVFAASPFVALHRFAAAVAQRDVPAVAERVNFRLLQASLTRDLARAQVEALGGNRLGPSERQMALGAAMAVVEPIVARLATAEALIALIEGADQAALHGGPTTPVVPSWSPGALLRTAAAVETRGFTRVRVPFPAGAPPDARMILELRLARGAWSVVALQFAPQIERRFLRELPGGDRIAAQPAARLRPWN